jgi:hypothetical protein
MFDKPLSRRSEHGICIIFVEQNTGIGSHIREVVSKPQLPILILWLSPRVEVMLVMVEWIETVNGNDAAG